MDPELKDFLYRIKTNVVNNTYTHITTTGQKEQINIPANNIAQFWEGYCKLVHDRSLSDDHYAGYYLAERPQDTMPVVAQLLFRFNHDDNTPDFEPYDDNFLNHICYIFQEVILENFIIADPDQRVEVVALVLESAKHWLETDDYGNQVLAMEIRIQFPHCRILADLYTKTIRPKVIQKLRAQKVLAKLISSPIGEWEQIIEPNSMNNPLTMYGSSSDPIRPKLLLNHIWFEINLDEVTNNQLGEDFELNSMFNPLNHNHFQIAAMDASKFQNDVNYQFWLPMFLSTNYWPTVTNPKTENEIARINEYNQGPKIEPVAFGSGKSKRYEDETKMDLCEQLLPLLTLDRYRNEVTWKEIGKALYDADNGDDNGLFAWIRHTEKMIPMMSKPADFMIAYGDLQNTCRSIYPTFATSAIDWETIAFYAKQDKPVLYSNWHRAWCLPAMERALSGLDADVADAFHKVYFMDYKYSSIGAGRWFQYKDHRWKVSQQGLTIRGLISGDFRKRFESLRIPLAQDIRNSDDENYKSRNEVTMKKLNTIIADLARNPFKRRIMSEICEKFEHDRFGGLLDSNSDLLGVKNGVIEINNGVANFRSGKPQDYISMSTGIPYHSNYNWNHELVAKCLSWLGQVFTDDALLHHFLKFSASCLKGRNSDKIFPIFSGDGDNSKSMIVKLFENTFRDYCIKFDVSNVTAKNNNPSSASPQLARAKATRIAFMDEADDTTPMNKTVIKRWIGGDSFYTRMLHDNGGDIQVTFKLVLCCNKIPAFADADQATKNRTRIFPFMSNWVDHPPATTAERYRERKFQKDVNFERNIPVMAPAFLWIITRYFTLYSAEKLNDPEIVVKHTDEYWANNDVYAQFTADNIVPAKDDNGNDDLTAKVSMTDLYSEFKLWFKEAFPGARLPTRPQVKFEYVNRLKCFIAGSFCGIRLIKTEGSVPQAPDKKPQVMGLKPNLKPETIKKPLTVQELNTDGSDFTAGIMEKLRLNPVQDAYVKPEKTKAAGNEGISFLAGLTEKLREEVVNNDIKPDIKPSPLSPKQNITRI